MEGRTLGLECRNGEMRDESRELRKPREVAGANVGREGQGQMNFRTEVMKNG